MRTILAILLSVASVSVSAATLNSARTKADTWLTNTWPTVVSAQNTYFASHGRYWQGLLSCGGTNSIPNFTAGGDGDAVQVGLASKPDYQSESIADIFPSLSGVSIPAAFECTQYIGDNGVAGYVVRVWVRFNGTIYTRAHNNGPETWRESAWSQLLPHFTL